MRIGFGLRHPAVPELLAAHTPAATEEVTWADGTLPLRISAYTQPAQLPDLLVVSVRCIVSVDDRLVCCENADGETHVWPGGQREADETYTQTASREVHEETGWLIDESSVREVGWLHLEHLQDAPDGHPYPHPDALQVVVRATAHSRDGGASSAWQDVEGYELASRLVTPEEARRTVTDTLCLPFLEVRSSSP